MSEYNGYEKFYIQTENGSSVVEATDEMVEASENGENWKIHYEALNQAHKEIRGLEAVLRAYKDDEAYKEIKDLRHDAMSFEKEVWRLRKLLAGGGAW